MVNLIGFANQSIESTGGSTAVKMPYLIYIGEMKQDEQEFKKEVELSFVEIIQSNSVRELIKKVKVLTEKAEVRRLRKEMVKVLRELEIYEILPRICKYMSAA